VLRPHLAELAHGFVLAFRSSGFGLCDPKRGVVCSRDGFVLLLPHRDFGAVVRSRLH
jgi:hypothetical protein